jgi:hypothetical protein
MAKMTIYLPDEIEHKARRAARERRISVSRWIADEVKRRLEDRWSPDFLAAAGSCPDFPGLDQLREGYGEDAARESLG